MLNVIYILKVQPIAFGVSFLHSQNSIDNLVRSVSFATLLIKDQFNRD